MQKPSSQYAYSHHSYKRSQERCGVRFLAQGLADVPGGDSQANRGKKSLQQRNTCHVRVTLPPQYCQVIIFPDLLLSHGNTTDPAAHIEVMSIGNLGPTANQRISSSVSEFIQKELGIDPKKYAYSEDTTVCH